MLNKYHLILILERMGRSTRAPRYQDVWPGVGIFVALLLALLPTDFKDYLQIKASVWEAIAVILTFVSAIWVVISLVRAYLCRAEASKTTENIVEEIIQQMQKEREAHQGRVPAPELNSYKAEKGH